MSLGKLFFKLFESGTRPSILRRIRSQKGGGHVGLGLFGRRQRHRGIPGRSRSQCRLGRHDHRNCCQRNTQRKKTQVFQGFTGFHWRWRAHLRSL